MITRAKSGMFKSKAWFTCIKDALPTPQWKQAMDEEYAALLKVKTWHLVPSSPYQNIVGNKWVFRLKRNSDCSIQRYKAQLVAKGFFINTMTLISLKHLAP
ncbi:hypothetical protein Csa_011032 [Cucumis sativus]|nr:hypothetical protein Csa_011032 [Cucumis sativus]